MFGKKKRIAKEGPGPFDNSRYWEKGDYKVHYRVDPAKGDEKAKFFILHGFWMNTMFYDELVEELTDKGFTCYRADLPSFGWSTRETKDIHYVPSKELICDMVADLDDGAGFILYGHSMGGSVAMEVAAMDQGHVKALILNAPMFMRNSNDRQAERFTSDRIVRLLTLEANVIKRLKRPIRLFMRLMTRDRKYAKKFDTKRFTKPFEHPDAGASLGFFTGHVKKPDPKFVKKNVSVPVLYVAAEKDLFVNGRSAKQIRKALPKGHEFEKLNNAGHCFPQADAEKAAKLAIKFLKKEDVI